MRRGVIAAVVGVLALAATLGCSAKRIAVGAMADALGGAGGGSFARDDDPELVRDALPFGLKLQETLLESDARSSRAAARDGERLRVLRVSAPGRRERAWKRATASGARALQRRASRLYLRGRDYALRGLEVAHPGFRDEASRAICRPRSRAPIATTSPFLYWAAAAQAGALTADKGNAELIADLPRAGAFMERVLALDESYGAGAAHEFFISYEASRPGGSIARAREHFARAEALAQGHARLRLPRARRGRERAGAEPRRVPDRCWTQALAVDVDARPAEPAGERVVAASRALAARRMPVISSSIRKEWETHLERAESDHGRHCSSSPVSRRRPRRRR